MLGKQIYSKTGDYIEMIISYNERGIEVIEYNPCRTAAMREAAGVTDEFLSQVLTASISEESSEKPNPGGKGEGFIFFTKGRQFVVKTISSEELNTLRSIIGALQRSKDSLVARVFGVYTILMRKSQVSHIYIMENLFFGVDRPLVFDIKGSSVNRCASSSKMRNYEDLTPQTVYMDLDFDMFVGCIQLDPITRLAVVTSLHEDAKFLAYSGIMDYSLILTISVDTTLPLKLRGIRGTVRGQPVVVYLGIVDYLQEFNLTKKLETCYKKWCLKRNVAAISSVPPNPYRDRFIEKVNSVFVYSPQFAECCSTKV